MSKQHNNTGDFDIPDILPDPATDTDLQVLTAPPPDTDPDLPEADEEITDTDDDPESAPEDEEDTPLPSGTGSARSFSASVFPLSAVFCWPLSPLSSRHCPPHRRQATT